AASITPATLNAHFGSLEKLFLELGLMPEGSRGLTPGAERRIWTLDEKGLAGAGQKHFKRTRVVGERGVEVAPPFVIATGSSQLKAWKEIWPVAAVFSSENAS
ncbi:unnamed protein product, partial [Symbiodinium sp. KB8]